VILAAASALRSPGDPSAYLVYCAVLTGERSRDALVRAVQDNSWIVRAAALDAIAQRSDPTLIPEIVRPLNDDRPEVRYTAAAAICRLSIMNTPK
jgi:HEAT repeat protein